jgi:hypothetical protein
MEMTMITFSTTIAAATSSLGMATFAPTGAGNEDKTAPARETRL